MLPDREGRFKAQPIEHGVAETGPNKLTTFTCRFDLVQELVNEMWTHIEKGLEITGYFYLEKRDRTVNTYTIASLKSAFGWDGRDAFWLQDTDLTQHTVQLKLGYEDYDGETRMKVLFIDAEDASMNSGSIPKADDAARRAINTRLGPKLRAHAGGTPVSTPKPTSESRPAEPQGSLRAKQRAWVRFMAKCPADYTDVQKEQAWFRTLGLLFPGKHEDAFIVDDWAKVEEESPAEEVPF